MNSKAKEPKETLNKFLTGMKDLSSQKKDVESIYEKMINSVYTAGSLDEKVKELISVGISVHEGNELTIYYHINQVMKLGATEDEVIEAALTAVVSGGLKSMAEVVTTVKEAIEAFK